MTSGAATYVWRASSSAWIKISEAESLDLDLSWTALTGKPSSTPSQIDAAVTAMRADAQAAVAVAKEQALAALEESVK